MSRGYGSMQRRVLAVLTVETGPLCSREIVSAVFGDATVTRAARLSFNRAMRRLTAQGSINRHPGEPVLWTRFLALAT